MYKVFLYNKPIILAQNQKIINKQYSAYTFKADTFHDVSHYYFRLEQDRSIPCLALYSEDFEQLTDHFFSLFEYVLAAGGIVKSRLKTYLFIFRHGKWDLPKGKVKKNEEIPLAAVREVEEETGISGPEILRDLPSTFHIYRIKSRRLIKRTCWYEMIVNEEQPLTPQTKEEITQARWMNRHEAEIASLKTYHALKELIQGYLRAEF